MKVTKGVIVRDRPAPESQGAIRRRAEPVGTALNVDLTVNIDGVNYARLIPQNPLKPEWVRVAERDNSIVYLDLYPVEATSDGQAGAINRLADAIFELIKTMTIR